MIDSGQLEIVSSNVGFNDIPDGLDRLAKGASQAAWWHATTINDTLSR